MREEERTSAGLLDEFMMKLLWICMYGFWKVISSVHSRVWAFIVTDSNLPRNKTSLTR